MGMFDDKNIEKEVDELKSKYASLLEEIAKAVEGQKEPIELMLLSLLCRGHMLLIGVPGLGKTLMSSTLAKATDLDFCRIQFTPDLMPTDITGTDVIEEDPETRQHIYKFLQGPVFANFILADEINRTPPKTQAALLQAMQEREVSIGRKTYKLEAPFVVMATQNPIENEGTYVLPEAQLDRFMFCCRVDYPSEEEEIAIVDETTGNETPLIEKVMDKATLLRAQELVRNVPVSKDVIRYATHLARATRPEEANALESVKNYITFGASPRASQTLILGAKARALLNGKYHVDFQDVRGLAHPVMRHRLVLNFHSRADKVSADDLINEIIEKVPTP